MRKDITISEHMQTEVATSDFRRSVMTQNENSALSQRNKLRVQFLDNEKMQGASYAKDLEKTLAINKEILKELLTNDPKIDPGCKKIISKFNEENMLLQNQVKKLIKERDELQAKILINEQIVTNLTTKQTEQSEEFDQKLEKLKKENEQKIHEIEDILEYKEFELQELQLKHSKAINLIQKYGLKYSEILAASGDLLSDSKTNKKITNTIAENEALSKEIELLRKKLVEADSKILELKILNSGTTTNDGGTDENRAMPENNENLKGGAESARPAKISPMKFQIPSLDLSKVKQKTKPQISDHAYIHKLEDSIKLLNDRIKDLETENRDLQQKIMQLENTNSNLIKLNMNLSHSLQDEKDKNNRINQTNSRNNKNSINKSYIGSYRANTDISITPKNNKNYQINEDNEIKQIKIKEICENNDKKDQSFG